MDYNYEESEVEDEECVNKVNVSKHWNLIFLLLNFLNKKNNILISWNQNSNSTKKKIIHLIHYFIYSHTIYIFIWTGPVKQR